MKMKENSVLKHFDDPFVVEMLISDFFCVSDYYTRKWDKEELNDISNFLNFIENTESIRLPLIPTLELWTLYSAESLGCSDCYFMSSHTEYFIEFLKNEIGKIIKQR